MYHVPLRVLDLLHVLLQHVVLLQHLILLLHVLLQHVLLLLTLIAFNVAEPRVAINNTVRLSVLSTSANREWLLISVAAESKMAINTSRCPAHLGGGNRARGARATEAAVDPQRRS